MDSVNISGFQNNDDGSKTVEVLDILYNHIGKFICPISLSQNSSFYFFNRIIWLLFSILKLYFVVLNFENQVPGLFTLWLVVVKRG